ncbi:O-antigen ligase family protein [Micromonospora zamorensis]|uniref:O-antigen ligase family protein n=1 Tax=Micromonospora zamorensis TaxID=709883 RepID=UPI003792B6BD
MPNAVGTPAVRKQVEALRPAAGHAAPHDSAGLLAVALLCAGAFVSARSQDHPNLCLALIVGAIALSGRAPRLRPADVAALAVAVWAVVTRMWTVDGDTTLDAAMTYASAALIFVAIRHLAVRVVTAYVVGGCYLLGCVLSAWGVVRAALGGNLPARSDALDLTVRFGVEGVNLNFTAYTLATGCLLASLLLTVRGQHWAVRALLALPLPVLACGVLLNGTKGALVALTLIPVHLLASRLSPRVALTTVSILVPTSLILVPLGLGNDFLRQFDINFGQRSTGDLSGRLLVWPEAIATWSDNVFLGIGAGSFPLVNSVGVGAHNLLLTVGNDLGLLGLLAYAAVFALALGEYARQSTLARQRAGLYLVTLFPIWLTGHWETALGAWLTLGLLTALPNTPVRVGRHRRTDPVRQDLPPASGTGRP